MKKQTGITLIALIITIIVLLILAGVTINLTLGEKGIFKTAQRAVQNYKDAQDQELTYLNYFEAEMNNTIKGLGTSSVAGGSTSQTPQTPTTPPTPPSVTYQAYNVGDTVTLNNNGTQETFYVIKQSPSNESTLTLLAKNTINLSTLKQSATFEDMQFTNDWFWENEDVGEIYDSNTFQSPAGVTTAVDIARAYGNAINASATGRLMTYNEAINLKDIIPDILYGRNGKMDIELNDDGTSVWIFWWLSTVDSYCTCSCVRAGFDSQGRAYSCDVADYTPRGDWCGVRPVIEIPKSLI